MFSLGVLIILRGVELLDVRDRYAGFGSHLRSPRCLWRTEYSSLQPFDLPVVWFGQLVPRSLCPKEKIDIETNAIFLVYF